MFNIFQRLVNLVMPIIMPIDLAGIGAIASGTGALMKGTGALMGGGGEESIRSTYPAQTMDYTNYAMAMQRTTRNKILSMLAKRSYEGYEGGKGLADVGYAAAMEGTKTPTPDYFGQARAFAKGDEGSVGDVLSSFAPSTTIYKDPSELTEWDKIAEENGITITKYNNFESKAELREALFNKNKSEVEVSEFEALIGGLVFSKLVSAIFPGIPLEKMCGAGQCDDMYAGVIRGIKAASRTSKQMGGGMTLNLNPALETKET